MSGLRRVLVAGVGGSAVAIDNDDVIDVLGPVTATSVPLAAWPVSGVAVVRGEMVTVLDVRRLMGLSDAASTDGVTVLVADGNSRVGLVVDSVGEFAEVEDAPAAEAGLAPPRFLVPARDRAGAPLLRLDTTALEFSGGPA